MSPSRTDFSCVPSPKVFVRLTFCRYKTELTHPISDYDAITSSCDASVEVVYQTAPRVSSTCNNDDLLVITPDGSTSETGKTRMWANAQRNGRPAEYRWHPLFNAAKFG